MSDPASATHRELTIMRLQCLLDDSVKRLVLLEDQLTQAKQELNQQAEQVAIWHGRYHMLKDRCRSAGLMLADF